MTTPDEPQKHQPQTRRAFIKWAAGLGAGLGGIAWLKTRSTEDGIPWPLRRIHQANQWVGEQLFSSSRRVREFNPALATEPKVNGSFGYPNENSSEGIIIETPNASARRLMVPELIGGLPRIEETTEIKCIEGWSAIVTWAGVRFADVANRLGVSNGQYRYVALSTTNPANNYYVGLDSASAFHQQTLLCDSMNGKELPINHGGPLRLIIPVKYGIKNIKWIGKIQFLNERPADFWAERGYDWYAGL